MNPLPRVTSSTIPPADPSRMVLVPGRGRGKRVVTGVAGEEDDTALPPPVVASIEAKAEATVEKGHDTGVLADPEDNISQGIPTEPTPVTQDSVVTEAGKRKRMPGKKKEPELDENGNPVPPKKRVRKPKAEPVLDENGEPVKKERKKRAVKEKPPKVYDIPDVTSKTTTFHGRLGYACLNTVLRAQKPSVFTSRTLRMDSLTKEDGQQKLVELTQQNCRDLLEMLKWNEAHGIRLFRLSSEMFPFASHPVHGYKISSLPLVPSLLAEAGAYAREHNHRLTAHPGQFNQLASPTEKVVINTLADLSYHADMFELLGMSRDSVMILHLGGVYGDKEETKKRFRDVWMNRVKDQRVKERVVLENDELCYSVEDLLPICLDLSIPLVLDYHHDSILPSTLSPSELMPQILKTWDVRGGIKPKQHLSEERPGAKTVMERRSHADRCQTLPDAKGLPEDMDLMIEAKDKEQAVFELYRIYDLHSVPHDSLRPPTPAEEMTLQTKGRKSKLALDVKRRAEERALKKAIAAEGGESSPLKTEEDGAAGAGGTKTPVKKKVKEKRKNEAEEEELEAVYEDTEEEEEEAYDSEDVEVADDETAESTLEDEDEIPLTPPSVPTTIKRKARTSPKAEDDQNMAKRPKTEANRSAVRRRGAMKVVDYGEIDDDEE